MIQPIQPPTPPPQANEYLTELAQYYRELSDYHQQAAIAAAQLLGHVEALLGNDPGLPTQQVRSWLVDESSQQPAIANDSSNDQQSPELGELFEGMDSENDQEVVGDGDNNSEEDQEVVGDGGNIEEGHQQEADNQELDQKLSPPSLEQLHELFKADRGNMLHIDYIVHHFYGAIEEHQQLKILPPLLEQLKLGSLKHLWSQVPDAPDCWTFRLLDFPEFATPQDNPLFPDLKSEVLPTTKVAELLSINRERIYELRDLYPKEFVQGVDYFQNNRGHYFWSQSAIEKLKTHQKNWAKKPSDIPMLPGYQGLPTEKAIKELFKSNPSREWTIKEVLEGIYGKLAKKQESIVRGKITKSLSHGHLRGLWRRVPKKVGVYRPN